MSCMSSRKLCVPDCRRPFWPNAKSASLSKNFCSAGFFDRLPSMFCLRSALTLAVCSLSLFSFGQTPRFSISFSSERSAQPLDGRLLLLLSNDPAEEPRMQINDTARTQMVFGVTVDGWKPRNSTVVDDGAFGYPIRSLKDVPAGDY